jgi:formate hydrogenlyase subunit 6/NADH:ubiquinone oxidoreductase subunit I
MEACCGCGVCEAVCPVAKCVTMVNETQFANNDSQWEAWRENKEGYTSGVKEKIADPPERSHGFRFRGQYQEEVPEMLKIAKEG